jgi:hypothetical protein
VKKDDLEASFNIFKIQGFETPEEMFLVGYIMAHGGEQYILSLMEHDIDLLMKSDDPKFWLPHIKDAHGIWTKVSKEDVEVAYDRLRILLEARKANIPEWLKKK